MPDHVWITPEEVAERLDAHKHQDGWRACCPAHGGDNPSALSIARGTDSHGNPCTLLYCHAHQCRIQDICAALDIPPAALFCIHPTYARETRRQPRQGGPRIARLRKGEIPGSEEDIAQLMLEEMIVSDPVFLAECPPARQMLWRLLQQPARRESLLQVLAKAEHIPRVMIDDLRQEWGTDGG